MAVSPYIWELTIYVKLITDLNGFEWANGYAVKADYAAGNGMQL